MSTVFDPEFLASNSTDITQEENLALIATDAVVRLAHRMQCRHFGLELPQEPEDLAWELEAEAALLTASFHQKMARRYRLRPLTASIGERLRFR